MSCSVAKNTNIARRYLPLSMIEHELARVQQRPEDVFQRLLLVGVRRDQFQEFFGFRRGRLAAEATDVKLFDYLVGRLFLRQSLRNQSAAQDLLRRGIAVEQVQRLRQRWFQFYLAGTNGL